MADRTTLLLLGKMCPQCGATGVSKAGFALRKGGRVQSYKCKVCGHTFTDKKAEAEAEPLTESAPETDVVSKMAAREM